MFYDTIEIHFYGTVLPGVVRHDVTRPDMVRRGRIRQGMDNKQKEVIKPTSYRLPRKIQTLIDILHQKLMISKTAVVTLAVLYFAEKENVHTEKDDRAG